MIRSAGVLLPVASLPSKYGIGCFSKEAYEFVDALVAAGQSVWQILPLGPTSYGDSPYSSFSTFAGNPYYIDLEKLIEKGWLSRGEADQEDFGQDPLYVDYGKIFEARFRILRLAYERSEIGKCGEYQDFRRENAFWLADYALYMALKDANGGRSWQEFQEKLKRRDPAALEKARLEYASEIGFYSFLQYEFDQEWRALKAYANEKGIRILGDLPIYVALDSADAWARPELFRFDEDLNPVAVAGCPPDYFSPLGQLWGNPLYNWEYHRETDFQWWISRLKKAFELYDIVRIDHFRGFDGYYSIPFGEKTAIHGHWEKGPGYALFQQMKKELGKQEVIAEDLGFLTPSVHRLVKKTGFPGMKVLEFAFDYRGGSDYLPHQFEKNTVVYTGTHDNETLLGWYRTMSKRDRAFAEKYLDFRNLPEQEAVWKFIRAAYASVSDCCIIPMQDLLGLGSEARTNIPSTVGNNWKWRMKKKDFTKKLQKRMAELAKLYDRAPKPVKAEDEATETPKRKRKTAEVKKADPKQDVPETAEVGKADPEKEVE